MTATIPEGVSAGHFDIIFTHWGRTITLNRYNENTTNISGDIIDSEYGDDESITGILVKSGQKFVFDKEGFAEQGDGYLLLKYSEHSSDPPSQHDKVTLDSETFEIDSVMNRFDLYYYCRLYKVG